MRSSTPLSRGCEFRVLLACAFKRPPGNAEQTANQADVKQDAPSMNQSTDRQGDGRARDELRTSQGRNDQRFHLGFKPHHPMSAGR